MAFVNKKIDDYYSLYSKFYNVCVPLEEYEKLEQSGRIPKNMETIFRKEDFNRYFFNIDGYVNCVANSGAIMFLETWYHKKDFADKYKKQGDMFELFLYDDFLIIIVENFDKDKPLIVKPVAIPTFNIIRAELYINTSSYFDKRWGLKIIFKDDSVLETVFATQYRDDSLLKPNHIIESNCLLGYSLSLQRIEDSSLLMVDKFNEAINCNITLEQKTEILERIFPKDVCAKLKNCLNLNTMDFMNFLTYHIDEIGEKFNDLKEKLRCLANYRNFVNENKKRISNELYHLRNDLSGLMGKTTNGLPFLNTKFGNAGKLSQMHLAKMTEYNAMRVSYQLYYNIINAFDLSDKYNKETLYLAKTIYKKCFDKKITDLETEENLILFKSICKQLNVDSQKQNVDFFELGREVYDDKNNSNILDEITYMKQKEKSNIVGIIKYIDLDDLCEYVDRKEKSSDELFNSALNYISKTSYYRPTSTSSDWAILGGIADGLAGPAAGLAVANDIQSRNQNAKFDIEKARQENNKISDASLAIHNAQQKEISSLKKIIRTFKTKLFDDEHTDLYFDYLSCDVLSYDLLQGGYLKMFPKIEFKQKPKLNDIDIIIDGSIKIEIYDNDELVGDGYFCANGFDCEDEYHYKAGFNNLGKNVSIIGKFFDNKYIPNGELNFKFVPINLWMIER